MDTQNKVDVENVYIPPKEKLTIKADVATFLVWMVLITGASIGSYSAIEKGNTFWAVVFGIILPLLVAGYWYYVDHAALQVTYTPANSADISDIGCTLKTEREISHLPTQAGIIEAIHDYRSASMAWGSGYLAGVTGMETTKDDPFKAKVDYLQSLLDDKAYSYEKKGN